MPVEPKRWDVNASDVMVVLWHSDPPQQTRRDHIAPTTSAMIAQISQQFEGLLTSVTGPGLPGQRADQIELVLFRQLLRLGADLLQVAFDTQAAVHPAESELSPDGTRLHCHDRRSRRYLSIFGPLTIWRHAFTAPGQPVACPLDVTLSLPARTYSALLREWCA